MTGLTLDGIDIDARDPERLARFWAEVLGRPAAPDTDGVREQGAWVVAPRAPAELRLTFRRSDTPKLGENRIHLDLTTASEQDWHAAIARVLRSGGELADIGQGDEDPHEVLADPEGNAFCMIEPGNRFLAGTGTIGAVNCDGTHALGVFWSEALAWPLVWDEGEETAIQSPIGGAKITWSGPPLMERHGRDRIRLALSMPREAELETETTRLVGLGARLVPGAAGAVRGAATVQDPDGNEVSVRVRRSR